MTLNVKVKPLLKLPHLATFSWNLENWKASIWKTKNLIAWKLSLFWGAKLILKILFWIFDWDHHFKSSCSPMFYNIVVLKHFTEFIGKHLFKNHFFTEHLWTIASGFFCSHNYFLLPSELIQTRFFLISNMFLTTFGCDEYHELCIWETLLCEANNPVVATKEHTFLWDTTCNEAVFLGWLTD